MGKIYSASLQGVFKVSCTLFSCSLGVSVGGGDFPVLLLCHLSKLPEGLSEGRYASAEI